MKHIKIFEAFSHPGQRPLREEKTCIEINLEIISMWSAFEEENYKIFSTGISKDPLEAAAFALSAAMKPLSPDAERLRIPQEEIGVVKSKNEAYNILRRNIPLDLVYSNKENPIIDVLISRILNDLKGGVLKDEIFKGVAEIEQSSCRVYKQVTSDYGGYSFEEGKIDLGWEEIK